MKIEKNNTLLEFTKYILDLAQCSLSHHQFKAFRKLVFNAYNDFEGANGTDIKTHYETDEFNDPN